MTKHQALMHDSHDDVAVTIKDVLSGEQVLIKAIDGQDVTSITAYENVPLGHKISICDIKDGAKVIKYGYAIGVATQYIPTGAHVHIHNIQSLRWS
ncbi:MAG: UxaA family hydrolase [Candidatus Bathyarchaeota archaeon]|nr:UxaA family hydrolase [Candidatus Bathyarchaeota archaeon]